MTVCLQSGHKKHTRLQVAHFLHSLLYTLTHYRQVRSAPWLELSFSLQKYALTYTGYPIHDKTSIRHNYTAALLRAPCGPLPAFLNFIMRRRAASELPVLSKDNSSEVLPISSSLFRTSTTQQVKCPLRTEYVRVASSSGFSAIRPF